MAAYARARVLLTHLRRWAVCCPADMLELGAAQYLRDEREDDATEPTHDKSWAQAELSCMHAIHVAWAAGATRQRECQCHAHTC